MTLYKVLDVSKTATQHEIKRAYRRKAKLCHPDCDGGSAEEFEKVNKAYLILSDPASRQKYDATGDETLAAPDNSRGEILKIIAMALDKAVADAGYVLCNPRLSNLATSMRDIIKKQIDEIEKAQVGISKALGDTEKLLGRFEKKGDKVDFIEAMLRSKCDALQLKMQHNQLPLSQFKAAYDMLKDVKFNAESAQDTVFGQLGM